MRSLSRELRAQLDQLPREGAHILDQEGKPTWCYDPSYFVKAAQQLGVPAEELGRRAGWSRSYATRVLGLRPYYSGDGRARTVMTIGYDNALKLCRALGLDYAEVCV